MCFLVGSGGPGFLAGTEGCHGSALAAWRCDLPQFPSLPEEKVETGLSGPVLCGCDPVELLLWLLGQSLLGLIWVLKQQWSALGWVRPAS